MKWSTVIDLNSCIGCQACAVACKAEFNLPAGPGRISVKAIEEGTFPDTIRRFQVNRCAQCSDAPCVSICPTGALQRRSHGVVALDAGACLGCSACAVACPLDAISLNQETGVADKCDLCVHRLDQGLEPACASVCPTHAIHVADLDRVDLEGPDSAAPLRFGSAGLSERRPNMGLGAALRYHGARPGDLDPSRAARPRGGILQSSEQAELAPPSLGAVGLIVAGDPRPQIPWGPRTALLLWTRDIASGVVLVPAMGVLFGLMPADHSLWRLLTPVLALLYLAGSLALASTQLGRPRQLRLLLSRPNPRSALARTAWYSLVLAGVMLVQALSTLVRFPLDEILVLPTLALGVALPVDGVLMLRQCRGRTLWTGPLSPPRALFGAILAGSAMLLPFAAALGQGLTDGLSATMAVATVGWLPLALGEVLRPLSGPDARLAVHELRRGALRGFFIAGTLLTATAVAAPLIGALAAPLALAGLLLFEHAWIQAGQTAPQG